MNAPARRRGYTLVELLIVTILVSVLAGVVLGAMHFMVTTTYGLRERTTGITQLRMIVEYIRQDTGAARSVLPAGSSAFHIEREEAAAKLDGAWADGADAGIDYSFAEGVLTRTDVAREQSVVVASQLSEFSAEQVEGQPAETRIHLGFGSGEELRAVHLVWKR
jgi:prepilin-type N-terminal cleavage/methylation domain-containing protein